MRSTARLLPFLVVVLGLVVNCAPSAPPASKLVNIESENLGIKAIDLDQPWSLLSLEPEQWLLSDGTEGTLAIRNGEPDNTPNIEQAVRDKLAEFDSLEGGTSFGNQQLVAPIGLIYTARGSYLEANGNSVGELWGYTVHPNGGRMLILTYSYPGDSDANVRGQNLLAVLGALAPLTEDPSEASPS